MTLEKPPLLSDEMVIEWMRQNRKDGFIGDHYKQAQREADIRWYEERLTQ